VCRPRGSNGATGAGLASLAEGKGRLVSTEEAAQLVRLSPRTLEGYRDQGTGPRYYKLGPGARAKVVYKIGDLDEWLEKFVQEPKEKPTGGQAPKK
jgi:Helix-turn-helix domain